MTPITIDDVAKRLFDFSYGLGSPATGIQNGLHRAFSRGSGYGFDRTVPFEADPDPRRINWKQTLLSLEFAVDQFVEEKNISVFEVDDFSASQCLGSKLSAIAVLRALFAFVTGAHRDRFAAYGATNIVEPELTVPLGVYKHRALELAGQVLGFTAEKPGGGLDKALRLLPERRSLVILVSDFLDDISAYKRLLPLIARHSVVALAIRDSRELELPSKNGFVSFVDPETRINVSAWLDKSGRKRFNAYALSQQREISSLFATGGIDCLWLDGSARDVNIVADYFIGKEG